MQDCVNEKKLIWCCSLKPSEEKRLARKVILQQKHPQASTDNSSVIRQKGESQNGCFKKAKHAKISEKQTFLTLDTHTHVVQKTNAPADIYHINGNDAL